MKKSVLTIASVFIISSVMAQSLSKITIDGKGTIDVFSFGLPENVQVYVTKDAQSANGVLINISGTRKIIMATWTLTWAGWSIIHSLMMNPYAEK